ncbi:MAG: hypothetical protein KAJ44_02135 [Thermoplasmatales archaeon]|nr:hypothetical protein [Thermoplasmatales archaeon]
MGFLTRKRDKQVFLTGSSTPKKEYRRHYSEKPSFSTSANMHGDVKKMMKKDDSVEHGSKDYDTYKKRMNRDADSAYLKEYKKAEKRDDKIGKKQEKQQMKEAMKRAKEEDAQQDEETRHVINEVEGRG